MTSPLTQATPEARERFWQSLGQYGRDPTVESEIENEFPDELPVGEERVEPTRRNFFQVMGLSSLAAVAACNRRPLEKIIPFVSKPEEVTPGLALWYASACSGCAAGCGVLVKTRDGRPIKIEGNPDHPFSRGALCATGQAGVLALYDADRLRQPTLDGKPASLAAADSAVAAGLNEAAAAGKSIWLVTPRLPSPTSQAAVDRFLAAFPGARQAVHEPLGGEAIADAHLATHGAAVIPECRFDRAEIVVSFAADFLGTWLASAAFTRQYADARRLRDGGRAMSRHIQVEAAMSLTGSNADRRILLDPRDERAALAAVLRRLQARSDAAWKGEAAALFAAAAPTAPAPGAPTWDEIADQLRDHPGKALCVSGSEDVVCQKLVNVINEMIGAYGSTVDAAAPFHRRPAAARPFSDALDDLRAGKAGAVLFWDTNPVYDHPDGSDIAGLLSHRSGAGLTVSLGDRADETGALCRVVVPGHHPLEAWGDVAPRRGFFALRQPAVGVLWDTRAAEESLLVWAGTPASSHQFLRDRWERDVRPAAARPGISFASFWDQAVHDGGVELAPLAMAQPAFRPSVLPETLALAPLLRGGGLGVVVHASVAMRDGRLANNGWLQELPDPLSKVTWSNYAALSPARARALGVLDGDFVDVTAGGRTVRLPVLAQPGQHDDVVAVAAGYGRTRAGHVGNGVGWSAFPLAGAAGAATVARTGLRKQLAQSQTHASQEGRRIVRVADHAEWSKDQAAGNQEGGHGKKPHRRLSLWPGHAYRGRRWGMVIDLAACTGCSACVVSCQAENNVTVVGEDEVRRRRDMAWLRIDRYYAGDPSEPDVVHQPMMCQHCENAPCETVCPVLATVHSSEGLNQQVYNRCVGTRYCANNCPPKVRRFNWFEYRHDDPVANMVLNPDVAVRSRGVMEKCSMCAQRISEGKGQARIDGRPVRDGDIRTACQQSCPAQAIEFGDLNDPGSRVARLATDPRRYTVFSDIGIGESVSYLVKIRNAGKGRGA